jgi:RNA polymerase sigma factor (sigma-70 family)
MRPTGTYVSSLVAAAQAGDRRALDDLVAAHLPLVYSIVSRALSGDPDADDVVQATMLRALRDLGELRRPESFRVWLAAIAVRQVGTHLHRQRRTAERTTTLDELAAAPDADFEDRTVLRVELSEQRRQVMRASRWLDPDDRALLSLWWLETAGQLSRHELAAAAGISVAHAGVRVQRMRAQLEISRSIVTALEARPRCARLDAAVASWRGRPSPLWRKRIHRHVASCIACGGAAADGMVATERLLIAMAVLPVPLALTEALLGKVAAGVTSTAALSGASTVGGGTGLFVHVGQVIAAHPLVAAALAGTVIAGAVVTTTSWPAVTPGAGTVAAAPQGARATAVSPSGRPLARGRVSLESANQPGFFVAAADTRGVLTRASETSGVQTRQRATFEAVSGLNDAACFSFRLPDGQYLRHSSWRLRVFPDDGTRLFRGDTTFCPRPGALPNSILLESSNYPGWFLRHRENELWVDQSDGSSAFKSDSSFFVRLPLGG